MHGIRLTSQSTRNALEHIDFYLFPDDSIDDDEETPADVLLEKINHEISVYKDIQLTHVQKK